MSLEKNLANIANVKNINVSGVTENSIDPKFQSALEFLITNWVSSGSYTISVDDIPNNLSGVTYITTSVSSGSNANLTLQDYVKKSINPSLKDGDLVVTNDKISFIAKTGNTAAKSDTKTSTSDSKTDSKLTMDDKKSTDDAALRAAVEKHVYSTMADQMKTGTTETSTTEKTVEKESTEKRKVLQEEINRMKKLMKLWGS